MNGRKTGIEESRDSHLPNLFIYFFWLVCAQPQWTYWRSLWLIALGAALGAALLSVIALRCARYGTDK